jgi:DhnA family fructose-bisphosphate aldolase class Ia
MEDLIQSRVDDPDRALRVAQSRRRRRRLAPDGRLNIVATDHPARRVTKIGDRPLAMADRQDLLARIVRVLMSEGVDGVMATMDVIEELLILHDLSHLSGGASFLDEKVLIGSMNRGGLAGTAWEMGDPVTGATPATCAQWNLDGAKFLLRICDDDRDSLKTILASVEAINQSNALGLPMFLEPLPVIRQESTFKVIKTSEALAQIAGVASAMGDSSRYLWLKLPYCDNYSAVARATTLPILLLGGESSGDPMDFLRQIESGLAAGPNVRGALVGRNVLFPGQEQAHWEDARRTGKTPGALVKRQAHW